MKIFRHIKFNKEYFLFLLPLFFVLHGYAENKELVSIQDAVILALYYLLVITGLATVFSFIFLPWRKAALFTFFLCVIHFFFGSFHDALKESFTNSFFTKYLFLLPLIAAIIILALLYIKKRSKSFKQLVTYLNMVLLIFLFYDIALLVIDKKEKKGLTTLPSGLTKCDTCKKPDVYLIIADEYPGQQTLLELFDYDNSPFIEALTQRGFYTIKDGTSNYNFTPFSVASILSYDYLRLKNVNHTKADVNSIMQMISNNKVVDFFSGNGYQIINNSFFELKGIPSDTRSSFLPAKTTYITDQTLVSRLKKDIYFNFATRFKIKWVIEDYLYFHKKANQTLFHNTIRTIKKTALPKFSYTHLMMPHYPFYYDADGGENSFSELLDGRDIKKFIGYLQYSNKKYLQLFDAILTQSAQPPIIIFMSDHGFREFSKVENKHHNFINMCSIYLPNKNYSTFYDGMSNVNIFRVILNTQFKQTLPLLKDSSIFLQD